MENPTVVVVVEKSKSRVTIGLSDSSMAVFEFDLDEFYRTFGTEKSAKYMFKFLKEAFGLHLSERILEYQDQHRACEQLSDIYENAIAAMADRDYVWLREWRDGVE